VLYARK
jgi:hypothetical protein